MHLLPCAQDGFILPRFFGNMSIENGNVSITAETQPLSSLALIPGDFFTVYDFKTSVEVDPFEPSAGGVPPMVITAQGDVLIGGPAGFLSSLEGFIDTNANALELRVKHAGGWSPLPGAVGDLFRTPQFEGVVGINMGDDYLTVQATADWLTPIRLIPGTDMLRLVGHPTTSAPGLKLGVELTQKEKGGDVAWTVSVEGGIKLFGDHARAPPTVGFSGSVDSNNNLFIAFETAEEWTPLAGIAVRAASIPAESLPH